MNPFKADRLRPVFFSLMAVAFSLFQWQTAWAGLPKTKKEFLEQHSTNSSKFMDLFESSPDEVILTWLNTPLEGDEKYGEEKIPPLDLIHLCTEEVIFFFIKRGLDITTNTLNGWPLLFGMVRRGYLNVVRYSLVNGVDPTIQGNNGRTALHHAIDTGHIEMVKLLLEYGASYSSVITDQEKLLYNAVASGYIEVLRFLLDSGASPVFSFELGLTPLHVAAHNGHIEMVQLLIQHGANPDAVTHDGETPLVHAHPDVVPLLIQHGAAPIAPIASIIEQAEAVLSNTENLQGEAAAMEITNPNPNPNPNCPVCFENIFSHSNHYSSCATCRYAICGKCNRRVRNCPLCRGELQIYPIPRQMFFPASQ